MTALDLVTTWGDVKDVISHDLHLTHPVLHVLAGLLLYPVLAVLLRARPASWRPVGAIALLEGANEIVDFLRYRLSHWPWTPGGTLSDIALTLLPIAAVIAVWRLVRRRG